MTMKKIVAVAALSAVTGIASAAVDSTNKLSAELSFIGSIPTVVPAGDWTITGLNGAALSTGGSLSVIKGSYQLMRLCCLKCVKRLDEIFYV